MLALALLDRIVSIDKQHQWLLYLSNSGYLKVLVDSLADDDLKLQSLLIPQPPLLKALYTYESKMVRFCANSASVVFQPKATNQHLALTRNSCYVTKISLFKSLYTQCPYLNALYLLARLEELSISSLKHIFIKSLLKTVKALKSNLFYQFT